MNSSTELKKYGGNSALYLMIDRSRQRSFLRRNIKQALDQHGQDLRTSQSSANDSMCGDACEKAWSLPDKATMAALAAKKIPVLRMEVKQLFPTGANSNLVQSKVKTKTYAAPCRLISKVYHITTKKRPGADRVWDDIHTHTAHAMIQAWRTGDNEEFISVSMDEPVLVSAEQLKIQMPLTFGEAYRMIMADEYLMTISIVLDDHTDMKEVLSITNPQENPLPRTAGKLNAKFGNLLYRADRGYRSPLNFTTGGKSYPLGFDMSVDAGWEVSKEMPIQAYNQRLRCIRGEQLLSPISEPSTHAQATRLAYWFNDQVRPKAISVEGFLCLFCSRRDYHSLDRLYHHFKTEHDMFSFNLQKLGADARACLQSEYKVEVDISDKYSDPRASNNVADPREIRWVAPKKPFDLEAYLKGDESWIKAGLGLKKKAHLAPRIAPIPQGAVEPKKPVEVPDMPIVEKKRHRVPKAPKGLRFYRSDSKRSLEEGEYLSESDDEISEDWLKLRRNLATKDAEVAVPARVFMMKWDDYMQDEQLCGDAHLGDAVVRFARKYRSWLKTQERMGDEFLRKSSELYSDRIICSDVFRACVDLIDGDGSMMDALVVSAETRKRQPTPSDPDHKGSSSRQGDHRMKRKYIPGGPGGGGKWLDVLDDDKKRRSKKARPTISRETSMHSNQESEYTLPTPQDAEAGFDWIEEARQDNSTKPPLPEESPHQPTAAVQSGCTCGKVVDDDVASISCANLVSAITCGFNSARVTLVTGLPSERVPPEVCRTHTQETELVLCRVHVMKDRRDQAVVTTSYCRSG
ncbi:polycomb protein vefs-box [Diplodia corticola]|uniref:Polycomb protein vefs-box n=1 Tax=Diplodia corticola TaxID=236234 RepID=A0A1J9RVK5_9PEZI|nr:polycomb protein vefs-box [Diplodia corticola]OJD31525.1 polycomb protein vefs-box [Diplodia corticola]